MEVKFASKKKGPTPPQESPKSAAPAAAPAPASDTPTSGEDQFKKLMPLAILGLIGIVILLIYLTRRPTTPAAGGVATQGTQVRQPGTGFSGIRRPTWQRPTWQRPTWQRPTVQRPSLTGWPNRLFAPRRPAVAQPPPPVVTYTPPSKVRSLPSQARPPTKAVAAPTAAGYCLIFGAINEGNQKLAKRDIKRMAKAMRGMLWPSKISLHTKPCCKVVLGPYAKDKRQKAISQYNRLKAHYQARSLSEYNGLLDEIFPQGMGWENCP